MTNKEYILQAIAKGECLACGAKLDFRPSNRKYPYCDNQCLSKHPPTYARLEHEYGYPVREIIVVALNECATMAQAAELLSITRSEFHKIVDKLVIKRVYA